MCCAVLICGVPSFLQALAGALGGLSILYSLRRKSLPSDKQMNAFLMGFYDRIEAENLGAFSEFPVLFGLGAGYFNASLLRKLRLKHTPEGSVVKTIKLSALYGSKTNCREVYYDYYDYENWPKRAKTKTWGELLGLGLTTNQIEGATNSRPDRNKQWFLRVETESQDTVDHERRPYSDVTRYTRGRTVYKRNPACR